MKVPDDLDFNSQDSLKKKPTYEITTTKKHYYTDITCEAVRAQEKLFTFLKQKNVIYVLKNRSHLRGCAGSGKIRGRPYSPTYYKSCP
jgi:hypothetical protein